MTSLYIAWQDPETRLWHTVGCLTQSGATGYRFCYTAGAEASPRFDYLGRMHDLYRCYHSDTLFPLFANRILNRSRPEFPHYLEWLGVDEAASPMELLARSGGRRATDSLCVYPEVEPDESGWMTLYFFSHGLRYLPSDALEALDQLQPDTALQLIPEDHQHDRYALRLEDGTAQPLGYCPRYLNQSLCAVLRETPIHLTVARNNHQAPIQFRLLCEARFLGMAGKRLYQSEEHRSLARVAAA